MMGVGQYPLSAIFCFKQDAYLWQGSLDPVIAGRITEHLYYSEPDNETLVLQ